MTLGDDPGAVEGSPCTVLTVPVAGAPSAARRPGGPQSHIPFVFRLCAEPKVTTPAGLPLGEGAAKGDAAPKAAAQPTGAEAGLGDPAFRRPFPGWCDRSRLHSVIT